MGEANPSGVVQLAFDRPAKHNALDTVLIAQLVRELDAVSNGVDSTVRAVVLTGNGPSFCSGIDTREEAWDNDDARAGRRRLFRHVLSVLQELPVPTVAAVEGYALGAGAELAFACDLVVAADDSVFGLPELTIGAVPGGGGVHALIQRSGRGVAALMLLAGQRVEASRLHALGAVDVVSGSGGAAALATDMLAHVTETPAEVVRANVELLRGSANLGRSEALAFEDRLWQVGALHRSSGHRPT